MRPRSLAEAAERATRDPDWRHHLDEFLDTFYGAHRDHTAQAAMLRDEPALLGRGEAQALSTAAVLADAVLADAVLGGAGEHLARRWGLAVPRWVRHEARYLSRAVFMPDRPDMRGYMLAVTPVAFRVRLVFTGPDPLQRARFPYRDGVIDPPLTYPPDAS